MYRYLKKVWIIIYRFPVQNGLKGRDTSLLFTSFHQMELALNKASANYLQWYYFIDQKFKNHNIQCKKNYYVLVIRVV
jgi:hypothetical protein